MVDLDSDEIIVNEKVIVIVVPMPYKQYIVLLTTQNTLLQ